MTQAELDEDAKYLRGNCLAALPLDEIEAESIFPATVLVDTREGTPYHFLSISPWSVVPLEHTGLKTGDYTLRGFQDRLTIERKSIGDFLGSITAERPRFEREFERMAQMEFAAVVVEGELSDVLEHARTKTRIKTDSILGTVNSWMIRYGVHFYFAMGRRHAEIETLQLLYQFYRNEQKRFKQIEKALA